MCGGVKVCVGHLSIGALAQHFEQLELRRVGLLTALLHVVADVDLLQYAVILREKKQGNGKKKPKTYSRHLPQPVNSHDVTCNIHNHAAWK